MLHIDNSYTNYLNVLESIKNIALHSKRNPEEIKLILVTKGVSIERLKIFLQQVNKDTPIYFGENFYQEARDKINELKSYTNLSWHFIGHLQTNKAKYIAKDFHYLHTISSINLAKELNKHLQKHNRRLPCLIQVNLGNEPQKHGINPNELLSLTKELQNYEYIELKGLMTIHPYSENKEDSRYWFRNLRNLLEILNNELSLNLRELSMGMSNDYDIAIQEGATFIRIGTLIFGKRG